MKPRSSIFPHVLAGMLAFSLTAATALAQSASDGTIDEHTRLMQEYMAKRAEWVALRAREMERAKRAKETKAREAIMKKLDEDERALRAASANLAARVREAQQKHKGKK